MAALKQLRRRWLVALAIALPLPFIALPITGAQWIEQAPGSGAGQTMTFATLCGLFAVGGGLFARNQAYKAGWKGDVVSPDAYVKGNTLLFIALLAGAVGLFVISIGTGYPAPTFAAAPVFVALLAMNFPNGKPMRPAPPRIGIDREGP